MEKYRFGLVGKHISYSFSEGYFTQKFEELGLDDHSYENFDIDDIVEFPELITKNHNIKGLNVTIPYKESVIRYLNEISKKANKIGAVNTIRFTKKGLKGYNTDVYGFQKSIEPLLKNHHEKALIFGTGGASKAVKYALEHYFAFEAILSVSRNPTGENVIGYDDLDAALMGKALLVVNTTPLGMFPDVDSMPALPIELLQKDCLVFDLTYNPTETKLLKAAKAHGCMVKNGLAMLVKQADAGWAIWNGELADPDKR